MPKLKKLLRIYSFENAENPNKVVQALRHAVMNTKPHIRYRPGWQSTLFFLPFSMVPTWLADLIMANIFGSGVLPAGVPKQFIK